jgi:hypothetical protein
MKLILLSWLNGLVRSKRFYRSDVFVLGCLSLSLLTGCETPGQSALAGAGTGAVMGGMLKGTGRGMAQGAAIGAAGGYVLGAYGQAERQRGYVQGRWDSQPAPVAPVYYAQPPTHRYGQNRYSVTGPEPLVYGRHSGRFGFVYSPYGRGNLVDVRGLPHGAMVEDPYSGRVFLNP